MILPSSSVNDSIQAKTEVAVAHYLARSLPALGLTFRTSSRGGGPGSLPLLNVRASSVENNPELPPADENYLVSIETILYWPAVGANERPATMDDALMHISCALWDIDAAQSFMNLASSGVDARPVAEFHLHDIEPVESNLETESSNWIESRTWVLTVVDADQTFAAAASSPTTPNYITLGGNHLTLGGNRITLAS